MTVIRSTTMVLARLLLTAVFLAAGVHKIFHWNESEIMMIDVLSEWQSYLSFSESGQQFFSSLILFAPLLLFIVGALEIVGGLLLLLGIREKLGAFLLIVMLIPTTILFHQFWFVDPSEVQLQQIMFLKNLAILGGLFLVLLFGAQTSRRKDDSFRS
jgi:uncharacterized membrane protein YphA (DoxX/SURF4 family)